MTEIPGKKTGVMVSPRNGAQTLTGAHPKNTGGKKGRSGRKPDWLKKFCDDLLASPKCKTQVREILEDKSHPAFKAMWAAVADRAHGKPIQGIVAAGDKASLEAILAGTWSE